MDKEQISQILKMVGEGLVLVTTLVGRARQGDSQADQCLAQAQQTVLDLQNNISQVELDVAAL